jgi:hypothetical protein
MALKIGYRNHNSSFLTHVMPCVKGISDRLLVTGFSLTGIGESAVRFVFSPNSMYNCSEFGGFMEITWYGHSCFRLTQQSMATVVTDPYDHREVGFESLKLKADIVTVSHNLAGHNFLSGVKSDPYIIRSPGEYEVGQIIKILNCQTFFA